MLEIWADETLPCLCGKGIVKYEMCENENFFVFGTMKLLCPYCSEAYKIEFDERKTPFEERTFYLVPKNKSIHGDERYSVLKESICIPTPNFDDPKEDDVRLYKEICAKKNRNFNKI